MPAPTKLLPQEMPFEALYWSRLCSCVPAFRGRLIDKSQLFERSQELDDIGLSNLPADTTLLNQSCDDLRLRLCSFDQLKNHRAAPIQAQKATFPDIQHNRSVLAVRAADAL
jgi:hypothetical protein